MLTAALLLAVVVAAPAQGPAGQQRAGLASARAGIMPKDEPSACTPVEQECVRVACEQECWEVRVSYESAEGPQRTPTGGLWGSISGARCHADKVASQGFWLDPASALQPTKVPPGALRLVVIDIAFPDR